MPSKASTPLVDYSLSSRTSIHVYWELNEDGLGVGGKISGYKLFMDDGVGGDFAVVFDTVGFNADINSFTATGLTTALQYRFYLQAFNFNQLAPGPISDIAHIYV